MKKVSLSVLDLCPVVSGKPAAAAFQETLELAQFAEKMGCKRYWVAEHHSMARIASSGAPFGYRVLPLSDDGTQHAASHIERSPGVARLTPAERTRLQAMSMHKLVGSPETLRKELRTFLAEAGVDELMVLTMIPDPKARQESYARTGENLGI